LISENKKLILINLFMTNVYDNFNVRIICNK